MFLWQRAPDGGSPPWWFRCAWPGCAVLELSDSWLPSGCILCPVSKPGCGCSATLVNGTIGPLLFFSSRVLTPGFLSVPMVFEARWTWHAGCFSHLLRGRWLALSPPCLLGATLQKTQSRNPAVVWSIERKTVSLQRPHRSDSQAPRA